AAADRRRRRHARARYSAHARCAISVPSRRPAVHARGARGAAAERRGAVRAVRLRRAGRGNLAEHQSRRSEAGGRLAHAGRQSGQADLRRLRRVGARRHRLQQPERRVHDPPPSPGGPMKIRLLPLLFLATAAAAQVRENITVNLVEVPVTVVDSSGNAVRGLTAANFELFDQGKKQQITSFDTVDFTNRDAVSAIAPMNPAARRSFLLLFDLGYSGPNSLARAQEAARRFVKESVQPRDLVGVGTIDVDRGLHLLAAFTTDRDLVASAIG